MPDGRPAGGASDSVRGVAALYGHITWHWPARNDGNGRVMLDAGEHIVFCNASARRMLVRRDGLWLSRGRIAAHDPRSNAALGKLVADTISFGPASPADALRVHRPSGAPAYELLVIPISPPGAANSANAPRCAIVIREPMPPSARAATLLAQLYGLTRSESRLALLLLNGATLREAAEQAGVRRETMRTHLKGLFQKTDTSRQHALTSRLSASLSLLACEPEI